MHVGISSGLAEYPLDRTCLIGAYLKHEHSACSEMRACVLSYPSVEIESVLSPVERESRLIVSDLYAELVYLRSLNVRRIADDHVVFSVSRKSVEHVSLKEYALAVDLVEGRVAHGCFQRFFRNVSHRDNGIRVLYSHADAYRSASCAHVKDVRMHPFLFLDDLKSFFNDDLGIEARYQDIPVDSDWYAHEVLHTGDVLERRSGQPVLYPSLIFGKVLFVHQLFAVRDDLALSHACSIREYKSCFVPAVFDHAESGLPPLERVLYRRDVVGKTVGNGSLLGLILIVISYALRKGYAVAVIGHYHGIALIVEPVEELYRLVDGFLVVLFFCVFVFVRQLSAHYLRARLPQRITYHVAVLIDESLDDREVFFNQHCLERKDGYFKLLVCRLISCQPLQHESRPAEYFDDCSVRAARPLEELVAEPGYDRYQDQPGYYSQRQIRPAEQAEQQKADDENEHHEAGSASRMQSVELLRILRGQLEIVLVAVDRFVLRPVILKQRSYLVHPPYQDDISYENGYSQHSLDEVQHDSVLYPSSEEVDRPCRQYDEERY